MLARPSRKDPNRTIWKLSNRAAEGVIASHALDEGGQRGFYHFFLCLRWNIAVHGGPRSDGNGMPITPCLENPPHGPYHQPFVVTRIARHVVEHLY